MIFDISGTLVCSLQLGVKLAEYLLQWFATDIGQYIETTPLIEKKQDMQWMKINKLPGTNTRPLRYPFETIAYLLYKVLFF